MLPRYSCIPGSFAGVTFTPARWSLALFRSDGDSVCLSAIRPRASALSLTSPPFSRLLGFTSPGFRIFNSSDFDSAKKLNWNNAVGPGGTANLAVMGGNLPPSRAHGDRPPLGSHSLRSTVGLVARQNGPVARSTQTLIESFRLSCGM